MLMLNICSPKPTSLTYKIRTNKYGEHEIKSQDK